MKFRFSQLAFLLALILLITGCDKDDDLVPGNIREQLVAKKWKRISIVSTDSAGTETDLYTPLAEFQKDDYLLFNADSTYELNDNLTLRADTVTRIVDAGKWELVENNTAIRMYSNIFLTWYEPLSILTLNEQTLEVKADFASDRSSVKTVYQRID